MRSHTLTLISFFSIIIILCIVPLFFLGNASQGKKNTKSIISLAPIPSEMKENLRQVHKASASGAVLCTKEDPSICASNQEGKILEYSVGCNGIQSASSVYICRSGRWIYVNWTPNGYCQFCKKK